MLFLIKTLFFLKSLPGSISFLNLCHTYLILYNCTFQAPELFKLLQFSIDWGAEEAYLFVCRKYSLAVVYIQLPLDTCDGLDRHSNGCGVGNPGFSCPQSSPGLARIGCYSRVNYSIRHVSLDFYHPLHSIIQVGFGILLRHIIWRRVLWTT